MFGSTRQTSLLVISEKRLSSWRVQTEGAFITSLPDSISMPILFLLSLSEILYKKYSEFLQELRLTAFSFFAKQLHNEKVLGTSRYSTVYGLINSSLCALIMMIAFVTDNEAKKFFRRKIKNCQEKISMKNNRVDLIKFRAFQGFEANDLYVIDIQILFDMCIIIIELKYINHGLWSCVITLIQHNVSQYDDPIE